MNYTCREAEGKWFLDVRPEAKVLEDGHSGDLSGEGEGWRGEESRGLTETRKGRERAKDNKRSNRITEG